MTPASTRASRVTGLKAILFDKDGTLLDYFGHWLPRANKAIATLEAHFPTIGPELRRCLGIDDHGALIPQGTPGSLPLPTILGLMERALDSYGVAASRKRSALKYLEHMLTLPASTLLEPFLDLGEFFDTLHGMGLVVGVITNDYEGAGRRQLQRLGVFEKLDYFAGYKEGAPFKPNPRTLLRFCESFDIPPQEVAFVGDSRVDVEMAVSAGASLCVGVLTGVGARETLFPFADVALDSAADLLPVLEDRTALTAGIAAR